MQIRPEKWSFGNQSKDFLIGVVTFCHADIAAAADIVEKKIKYVDVHSPAGVARNIDVIRSRLLAGKLADHAVAGLIEKAIKKKGIDCRVQEYDAIRDDDFKKPDPYDLALVSEGGFFELEVRSSFCYKLAPLENIINKLSSYGFYTTRTKQHEPPKDYYWQVVFYNVPNDLINTEGRLDSVELFENDVINENLVAYVVGGGPRSLFESENAVIRSDQDGAFYHSISPIKNGLDCGQLVNLILQRVSSTRNLGSEA
ncbi:hypothetical protein [Vibrio lentus]|uniref:hypothetical protein n=1 Tax=Vibrio lentus TaxID=136468 RepID=UPI0009779CBF|nr:hypothetical protein [Vibrio lentus]OMO20925.1 hypothetical protein BH583_14810 [Vibrio lentus]PMN11686.1 hypothetical protein BCT38_06230 [Vibrio lentus]